MNLVIGITGGIGSGKSAVTRCFEHLGITVVDADVAARVIVEPGGAALVALHGSWNRTERSGYKLIRIMVESGRAVGQEDFVTGWLSNGEVNGRPVYPAVGPDGNLYLSDDQTGRIYRIGYRR